MLQPIRSGSDRMSVRVLAVELDHFPRHRAAESEREDVREAIVDFLEVNSQRIPVGNFESRDLRFIIEPAGLSGPCAELVEPDDLSLEQERVRRAVPRVEKTFDRIGVVLRGKLPPFPFERRIGREIDALPDLERVGPAIVCDLRQRFGRVRNEFRRTRQIVVGQQPVVYGFDDRARVVVVCPGRIEAGFGDRERDAERFRGNLRMRCRPGGRSECAAQRGEDEQSPHVCQDRGAYLFFHYLEHLSIDPIGSAPPGLIPCRRRSRGRYTSIPDARQDAS